MKLLLFLASITFGLTVFSQKEKNLQTISCDGLRQSSIKASLKVDGKLQEGKTHRHDLINYGLKIYLEDTTFRVVGFVAGYDCHSRAFFDFNEREYLGNCIYARDPFIKGVELGDLFIIDCINVEKNGKRYLVHGLQFKVE